MLPVGVGLRGFLLRVFVRSRRVFLSDGFRKSSRLISVAGASWLVLRATRWKLEEKRKKRFGVGDGSTFSVSRTLSRSRSRLALTATSKYKLAREGRRSCYFQITLYAKSSVVIVKHDQAAVKPFHQRR